LRRIGFRGWENLDRRVWVDRCCGEHRIAWTEWESMKVLVYCT
jgi:hypothetical protein